MNAFLELTTQRLQAQFGTAIEEVADFRDERTIFVTGSELPNIMQFLRDEADLRFNMLEDIVADDYMDRDPRFAVSYHLYSIPNKARVRIRVRVADPDEGVPTLTDLWQIGAWLETEVYDLMGIHFQGHTALRRLFLPEDWQGHPLRKDYPLGYEEVQFTFNFDQIMGKKPQPKD